MLSFVLSTDCFQAPTVPVLAIESTEQTTPFLQRHPGCENHQPLVKQFVAFRSQHPSLSSTSI
jgi:hypothetical protein